MDEKVHESVELPDPVTLLGVMLHDVLFVLRLTIPAKPFRGLTATPDVPAVPTLTLTLAGLTVSAKSWTLYVTVTE